MLLVHSAQLDLIHLHLKSRATFCESYRLGTPGFVKGVVPKGYEVVLIGHSDNPLGIKLHNTIDIL